MDIHSLLSPDGSPSPGPPAKATASSPASSSPKKRRAARPTGGKRTSSGLNQEISRSPDRAGRQSLPSSSLPSSSSIGNAGNVRAEEPFTLPPIVEAAPNFRPLQQEYLAQTSAPMSSNHDSGYDSTQQRPVVAQRPLSTPQMETLADLAAMQTRHQPSRNNSSNNQHQQDTAQVQSQPSRPALVPRNASGQSMADLTMAEAPAQTPPPRNFTSSALSDEESQTVNDLLTHLNTNSYAYDSHVQLIGLLHKGFLAHVSPSADAEDVTPGDPLNYGLLAELRQAREAMDTRFAVGESIWLAWLSAEVLLAKTGEERITVTELSQKAVQDEPASVKLWRAYADWIHSNYAACNDLEGADQTGWAEEDKEMCRELFTKQMLIDVYEQAIVATRWRIDESHVIWNRYIELMQNDMLVSPSAKEYERIRDLYVQRLQTPHAAMRDTAQMLLPLVNRFQPDHWEEMMAQATEMAAPAQKQYDLRSEHEIAVQRALEAGNREALFAALSTYLQWEGKHMKRGANGVELCSAAYERVLLHFPTYTEWWLDYIDHLTTNGDGSAVLPLIERATRHCPWSGDLWAKRILRSDVEGRPHDEIEATKHRATNSGLLDVGGMEELLKVLQQWCSYLRRHAFSVTSADRDDGLDAAEVAIASSLEDIEQAGKNIYGEGFQGDPLYRLETIQIKFLTESRRLNDARDIYRHLVPLHRDSFDFWVKYYTWEVWLWAHERMSERTRMETADNGPHLATAVVREALSQRNIDQPEKMLDMYLNHFQQQESGLNLQTALVDAREYSKHLAARRAKEAADTVAAAATQQASVPVAESALAKGGKRKADEELANGDGHKKPRSGAVAISGEGPSGPAQVKRDREHNTITVRNLPIVVEEKDIKKFFRGYGQPLSINILQDQSNDSASATVEFETAEDVLTAKTRNGKDLNGREVRINSGSQNTLYVANYPAEYDDASIRGLFDSYGDIVSVRFPSLKFDSKRRFCYVNFLTEAMAKAAEDAMNNMKLDGKHQLLAKIANPDAKKQRSGAQAEGRELFVRNMDRDASEDEVKQYFGQYGSVVSLNLVKLVNGKRTGNGFIVFATVDEANAALAANNKPFGGRILHVEISAKNAEGRAAPLDRARKTDIVIKPNATSMSPDPDGANGERRGSDISMASAPIGLPDDAYRTAKERKIAIFNLPDTVNDGGIRAAMEEYGPIVKIQLRRQENGAIIEFVNVKDAFNVRQGVECKGLGEEVKTGDVADLLQKVKKRQAEGAPVGIAAGQGLRPHAISRPGEQRGGGRRGGLGFKRGGGYGGAPRTESAETEGAGSSDGAKKGNADFRAMLEQSKAKPKPEDEGA
ncbi:Splicing factor [Elasticomyces elasticus]|nr:Splicing factor [Elasticomyces elasticus]